MKKITLLIVTLLSAAVFSQIPNWTIVKETNINVANASEFNDGVDIFTNRYGNHIIVQESNNLKYYNMNVNGLASSQTIESSAVVTPSICGDANMIRIVYGLGNLIRIKRSSDGVNWTQQTLTFDNTVSAVESIVSNGTLHITYQKSNQIWHRYNKVGIIWTNPQLVSEGENGEYPRITARYTGTNNDYVYFLWKRQGTHIGNWRRYEVTSNVWGPKNFGYEVFYPNLVSSKPAGFNVTSSTIIFYFYYKLYDAGSVPYFSWWWRDLNTNNPLGSWWQDYIWQDNKIYSTTTSDNKNHVVYYLRDGATNVFDIWRSNSEDGFWDDIVYDYSEPPYWLDGPRYLNVSSAGNEVHVIWKDAYGYNGGNNLRYKYDDQTPLAPTGLTITEDANHHPRLNWNASPEPDIHHYIIERYDTYGGGWQYLSQTPNGTTYTYTDETLTYCHAVPPLQCPDEEHFIFG